MNQQVVSIRENIEQMNETSEKLREKETKASENMEAMKTEMEKSIYELQASKLELAEKGNMLEKIKLANTEKDEQLRKVCLLSTLSLECTSYLFLQLSEELQTRSTKLEEINMKLINTVTANNALNTKFKDLQSEKVCVNLFLALLILFQLYYEKEAGILADNMSKFKSRCATLEAGAIKDRETIV